MDRIAVNATMLVAVALTAVGCAGDDQPEAAPSVSSTPSPSTPPSPAITSTAPAWQAKYTPDEVAAFEAALQRWQSYESRSEGIWAAGKATRAAERLFQGYNGSPSEYNRLVSYEAGDIQVIGLGTVLDSRPTAIELTGNAGSITIRQCVDYSERKTMQAGEILQQITNQPQIREINMYLARDPDPRWFISNVVRGEGKSPC